MASIPIALQLYTVRDHLKEDYVGTLKKVKEIGYDIVQPTGDIPYDGPELRRIHDDIGLTAVGPHIGLDALESDLNRWIDFTRAIGSNDLVCPYLPEERRRTRSDWLAVARLLDELGARCKEQGVRLSYHNHSFEFVKFDDEYALDLLYANSSPDHLYAEIDTYWVKHGGEDPAAYVRKYAGRLPLLHVKDMADDEERSFAEIGNGILDWDAIHAASLESGVECYCVEQDRCPGDSLDSARISLEFLKRLTGA